MRSATRLGEATAFLTLRALLWLVALMLLVAGGAVRADMVATSQQPVAAGGPASRQHLLQSDTTLRATAACVAKRAAGQSAYLLATVPGSSAEDRIVDALHSRLEWCMPAALHNGLGFPVGVLRGMLAEALYSAEFPRGIDVTSSVPAPTWEYPFAASDVGDAGRMVLEQTGRCTVTRAPKAVLAFLAATPFSDAEAMQMVALAPELGKCLAVGSKARMSRQALRGVLAEALYEFARAVRVDGATVETSAIVEKKN